MQTAATLAIESHLNAVMHDELAYDETALQPGNICKQLASDLAYSSEQDAFRAMVEVQCLTVADVQAKLKYILDGSVGEREPLTGCLMHEVYTQQPDDCSHLLRTLLRSMILPD